MITVQVPAETTESGFVIPLICNLNNPEVGTVLETIIAHNSGLLYENGFIILKIVVGVVYNTVHPIF